MSARKPTRADYRYAARSLFHDEGRIEVDDSAKVSMGDPAEGAYVQAWVWVPLDDALSARAAREVGR